MIHCILIGDFSWEGGYVIFMETDTIAAIATGLNNAGISIIRVSGDAAVEVADRIFYSRKEGLHLKDVKTHTIHYGMIKDGDIFLDEVLVSVMRAPNSYTKEDVVEINCHGGIVVTKRILETVLRAGARLAEPGEFTKRAFLNGRIDLSQAEAVMDIIHAKNDMAVKNSVRQLRGDMHKQISQLRDQILHDIAFIEAALDDPEHISMDGFPEKLERNISGYMDRLDKMLRTAENGRMMKEGIKTVILGKPNAGKSSLLNFLMGEDRAIVTDIPGTTRDVLEENVVMNGISLNLVDTAGIRWTEDAVEKIGVDKARGAANEADLILFVVDSSVEMDSNDDEILDAIGSKKVIVVLNKSDLKSVVSEEDIVRRMKQFSFTETEVIRISVKGQTGMEELERKIASLFFSGEVSYNDEIYITGARHKTALMETKRSLEQVMESLRMNMPEDFYSIDLMNAYKELGSIIGEAVDEDLVNMIFKEFCMGK